MKTGQTLAHYEIIRPLGKGGMGEVYLANDTKLKREVAIKVLPASVRSDEDHLRRFRREAEAAAKLNHSNIAHIHTIEDIEDLTFIVMEYVEGKTLAELIPSDGMDFDTFFDMFLPLTDALGHAHSQGCIHRDLKPANIMIAEDGTAKILDFGLARLIDMDSGQPAYDSDPAQEIDSQSPTRTIKEEEAGVPSLTRGGQLMGTPMYMSPEQAEREETDARTDIFSLGIVMYEAITGQRPFEGKTLESIIGRILAEEPKSITLLRPITPYPLWSVIRKCLVKERGKRMQTAEEMHHELVSVRQEMQSGTVLVDASTIPAPKPSVPASIPFWRQSTGIAAIAILTLIIGIATTWFLQPDPPEPILRKYQLAEGIFSVISPDGTMVAYIKTRGGTIWVRDLDELEAREIPNTEGARFPFWSPGSDFIGYSMLDELRKVAAQGGPSTTIGQLPGQFYGATWKPDGTILVGLQTGVVTVSAQGGELAAYLQPDSTKGERFLGTHHVLPDGQTLVLSRQNIDNSWDIVVQDGDTLRSLVHSNPGESLGSPVYASSGHILYYRSRGLNSNRNVWSIPFDLSTRTRTGDPILVAEDARTLSVSSDGTLVYQSVTANPMPELVWVDRQGQVTGTIGQPQRSMVTPTLSPDDRQVAVSAASEDGNSDIWIHDERGTKTRFTSNAAPDFQPAWSPDGKQIVFSSRRRSIVDLFIKTVGSMEEPVPLVSESLPEFEPAWSRDGQYVIYQVIDDTKQTGLRDLRWLSITGDNKPVPFISNEFENYVPVFSPNGKYVAYSSDESGRQEVYIVSFPNPETKRTVSVNGGIHPRWHPRKEELFFVEGNTLMAVTIRTEPELSVGTPQSLFPGEQVNARLYDGGRPAWPMYDVAQDGQRFIVVQNRDEGETPTITVVQNWIKEFETQK